MKTRSSLAALCSLVFAVALHAAPGAIALGGAPVKDRNAGAFRLTPDGQLVRMWREGAAWQCRPIFTWGPPPAQESLIAGGRGVVFGVNQAGALFNTYFDGPLSRYAPLQHPFVLQPRSLALGGEPDSDTGVFGITHDGKLARARWTGKPAWEFTIVPSWGPKLVAGSLISGDARIYGVNEAGQLVNTWMNNGVLTFAVIEGRNDFVPGSLALGGTPNQHSSVYGVSKTSQLVRAWWNNGWSFETAAVEGGFAPSLISGLDSVYGTNGKGQIVQGSAAGGALQITIVGDATGLVAGSLALGGAPALRNDIYGVDAQGRLVRTFYSSSGAIAFRGVRVGGAWKSAVVPGVQVAPKTLVSSEDGVYGLDVTGRPFAVSVVNGVPAVAFPCRAPAPGADQRNDHARVLREQFGIDDLSTLGTLSLGGALVPQNGLTRPRKDLVAGEVQIKAARSADFAKRQFVPLATKAALLNAEPFPTANKTAARSEVLIDTAYLAAKTIILADDTKVILRFPTTRHFVLIAETVTVGKNVTFTYERQDATPPPTPGKPGKPSTPAVPDGYSKGNPGTAGTAGQHGGKGWSFAESPAPEVEVWVLSMTGSPAFDLRGQDGGAGGNGGNGGDGGNGSAGSSSVGGLVQCKKGPGDGGDGGNGGRAGNGGDGGDGAPRGRLTFHAPASVVAQYASGFFITVDGGSAGPGGMAGVPGAGGDGGPIGAVNHNLCKKEAANNVSGKNGAQGGAGVQGASGKPGLPRTPDPIRMLSMDPSEFVTALEKPALETITVPGPKSGHAFENDVVTVKGRSFTPGDTILIEKGPNQWLPAETQVIADTMLTFKVPSVPGGLRAIYLEQVGTAKQSNKLSLYVLPKVVTIEPSTRIRPGTTVTVKGSGFAPGMRVFLNDQERGALTFHDSQTLSYLVIRPNANMPVNRAGEPASLTLRLADGTAAAPLAVVLDTYQIEVLGDSIAWGVGLQEPLKYAGLVEQKVRELNQQSNIGVYTRNVAHTGAIIGLATRPPAQPGLPAIPGEVSTPYPTVSEQLDAYAADPASAHVDLVLVTACINDIGVFTVLDPQVSIADLDAKIRSSCHDDLLALLTRAGKVFPSAKIVATSYFAPLSDDSAGARLVAFLIAVDNPVVKIPGEIVGGVLKPGTRKRVIENSLNFGTKSTAEIQRAVNDANAALGGPPRVFFADAKFGPQNAALAGPNAWLFGINADGSSEDLLADARKAQCEQHKARTDKVVCVHGSAGHPNVTGAQQFAKAIFPFL